MAENHALYQTYQALTRDKTVTLEDYYFRQKDLLKQALAALKVEQHPDLDYIVGIFAVYDGDKYNIPMKNAVGHLNRSYKNGHSEAGLVLSNALRGGIPGVPEELINKDKAREILEAMVSAKNIKATYELSNFYLDHISYTIEGGGYAPEEWFDLAHKYALEAAEGKYIGGYTMLGYLHYWGFGNKIVQNYKESMIYYQTAADLHSGPDDDAFLSDAQHNLGCIYYEGLGGVARDRKKALALINAAADLGNQLSQSWLSENADLLAKEGLLDDHDDIIYDETFDDLDLDLQVEEKQPALQKQKQTKH